MLALGSWFVTNVPVRPDNKRQFMEDGLIDHHAEAARRPISAILDDLVARRANVLCGGMAFLMQKVAESASYKCFTLNLGSSTRPVSHVIVVADIGVDSEEYAVYDPFFGYFISDVKGRPIGLNAIIAAVRRRGRKLNNIKLRRMGPRHKLAVTTAEYAKYAEISSNDPRMQFVDGGKYMAWPVDLKAYAAAFGRELLDWLDRSNNALAGPSVFDLLRFPLGTSGQPFALEVEAILRSAFEPGERHQARS
jgi:hypothetical protein